MFFFCFFTNSVRKSHLLTKYKLIDAKIAHPLSKLYVIQGFNVATRASRGPNTIPALSLLLEYDIYFRSITCDNAD